MLFKITAILGGKKAVKSLGAFCLLMFGICALIFQFWIDVLQPPWIIWVFRGGAILGLILLLGGIFATDVPDGIKEKIENINQ
ncbi:MAG: hypothetical protein COV69_03270 [Parcubacteria group bacterium CG11_big_fil_rev_8_21_14_0_20_39_14]|nr:MAG: hypothetical protein COV69_03270 [Parcubacteria group bacterium CG11_big_fil_rev_8_21_14_0_20_39_14]PIS35513.1 MAG: hypothetical protein COT36_01985 [Parcubacteria group bacterium CG08_land_8_20_14_0_20_38_56]